MVQILSSDSKTTKCGIKKSRDRINSILQPHETSISSEYYKIVASISLLLQIGHFIKESLFNLDANSISIAERIQAYCREKFTSQLHSLIQASQDLFQKGLDQSSSINFNSSFDKGNLNVSNFSGCISC